MGTTTRNRMRSAVKALLPAALVVRRLARRVGNSVLLTFDDGPDPEVTPAVLERLDSYGARAAFFVVGKRVERTPNVLLDIQQRGHVIGNHSYHHAKTSRHGFFGYRQELQQCQQLLEKHTGKRPRLFRPPWGRLTPTSLLAPKSLGLTTVTWSLDPEDWSCRTADDAKRAADYAVGHLHPGDIVLLHDDNPAVLTILDTVLPELERRRIDLQLGTESLVATSGPRKRGNENHDSERPRRRNNR